VRNLRRFDGTFVHTALSRHASGLVLTTLPPDLSMLRTISFTSAVSAQLSYGSERQAGPMHARANAALADAQPTSSTARGLQTPPSPIPLHFAQ
jgi:hypothetical protein